MTDLSAAEQIRILADPAEMYLSEELVLPIDDAIRIAEEHAAAETDELRAEIKRLRAVIYKEHGQYYENIDDWVNNCKCDDCTAHRAEKETK